jgi:nucleoside-diphosphate-sugar epimerase
MKLLVIGSQGYVGSSLVGYAKKFDPSIIIDGLDLGFFQHLNHFSEISNDIYLNNLKFKDLRFVTREDLLSYEAIVHLAAISNDPTGEKFSQTTMEINFESTIRVARIAKEIGIKKFIFASSASVYGFSSDICSEESELNPLTAYARSKVLAERDLELMSDDDFQVTILRFSTAVGWSQRFRSDTVLNNFVLNALIQGEIKLESTGESFRPLIDVNDMAKSILFSLSPLRDRWGNFEIYNVGQNSWNFRIIDLAYLVAEIIPDTQVNLGHNSKTDKRSYKCNFDKYNEISEKYKLNSNIETTIVNLKENIESLIGKSNLYFSEIIRLNALDNLIEKSVFNAELRPN